MRRNAHLIRVRTYRPRKDTREDIQSHALLKAIELYREDQVAALEALSPFQPIPPVLWPVVPGLEQTEWWPGLRDHLILLEVLPALEITLPLLEGKAEQLPERVRQALREYWRKWKTQKRRGTDISLEEEEPATDAAPVDALAEAEARLALKEVIKRAEERWGIGARRFVEAFCETGNVAAASEAASISRPTGHKYLRELRRVRER
jgi:hypothetical protein